MALLTQQQRLRIQIKHQYSIERYGYDTKALFWTSQEIQQLRFQVLTQLLKTAPQKTTLPCSILDVGCGFGDLYHYLHSQNQAFEYAGIDLSADMILGARAQAPNASFRQGDLFDQKFFDNQFDFVLLSGALNEVVETKSEGTNHFRGRYAKAVIQEMYRISRFGVAFNLLDARNPQIAKHPSDLQSFYPKDIVDYCQGFARKVEWRDDYLDNDFSVFLFK